MRNVPNPRHRRAALVACVVTLAALTAGCSSSAAGDANASHPPTRTGSRSTAPSPTPAPSSVPSTTPPATAARVDLSGSWSGQYSGTYNGTFSLSWQQKGSRLSGRITLSSPASTLRLNGHVNGTTITFGTVGSAAITYSGTVSGGSMSGAFQVGGGPGGRWSATKSS